MILTQFLPERSVEDILAGRVRLTFGGQAFDLPALTIDKCEAWQAEFSERLAQLFSGISQLDSAGAILGRLGSATDFQLELLRAYDEKNVLPDDAGLRAIATPDALLRATLEVLAAGYPLAASVVDLIARNPAMAKALVLELMKTQPPPPSSGSPRPTAGRRGRSAKS